MQNINWLDFTEIGPRKENEDSKIVLEMDSSLLCCVADGVGGLKNGKFASNYLIEKFAKIQSIPTQVELVTFLNSAHNELIAASEKLFNGEKMGSTFSCAIITSHKIYGVHVGDTRVSLLRGNGLKQLTQDQNEAYKSETAKKVLPEFVKHSFRKNVLESVVGIKDSMDIQTYEYDIHPGDRIILSSDGFHELLSKVELRDISVRNKSFPLFYDKLQIEIANRTLRDNTTFICVEIQ